MKTFWCICSKKYWAEHATSTQSFIITLHSSSGFVFSLTPVDTSLRVQLSAILFNKLLEENDFLLLHKLAEKWEGQIQKFTWIYLAEKHH